MPLDSIIAKMWRHRFWLETLICILGIPFFMSVVFVK